MAERTQGTSVVYVGTYTRGDDGGIFIYRMDGSTGTLEPIGRAPGANNPSFLSLHPSKRFLYSVNELGETGGKPGGGVSAFRIDAATGELAFLNRESSQGAGPCHLSVDRTGRWVVVANYSSGSTAILPIREDGRLGEATDMVQHQGTSVDPERQKGPHAHSVTLDPANRFAFVADLGLDKVLIYRLDLDRGKLIPNEAPWARTHPGAGPRHFAFHPDGGHAYVINELDSTMTVFAYDAVRGALTEIQMLSTLPEGYSETSYCADVHVSASGKYVYGSNRGHDSIAIFSVDAATGTLSAIGHEPTRGKCPRNFAIDPTGSFLLAANQDSDNIVTFRIDPRTGKLTATGHVAEAPKPVCLKLTRREG